MDTLITENSVFGVKPADGNSLSILLVNLYLKKLAV